MFVFLLGVVCALLIFQYLKLLRAGSYASEIETLRPVYPVLGHIPLFGGKNSPESFSTLRRLLDSVDRIGKFVVGPKPFIVIQHPELMQQVLCCNELYDKPFLYDFFRLGNGILTERCKNKIMFALINVKFSYSVGKNCLSFFEKCTTNTHMIGI